MPAPPSQDLLRSERLALVADLDRLPDEQWRQPSLCAGWRVVDVAAHLAWTPVLGPTAGAAAMARHRFSMNAMIAGLAVEWSSRGREAILAQLRTNAATGARPIGMPLVAALSDAVVHGIDVRRPLGLATSVPPDALGPVADFAMATPWPLHAVIGGSARRRVAGVRLVVPGVWEHGSGPEVTLSAEAALRLVYGRPVGSDEVSGAGVGVLRGRL
ncbi:maleylpyruvate isomerase family mycothiol-dependent enzyme [Nocardioides renjunii]|uniref:maleylpyruvate isomerase family mycothiol-dependent enzyme n=1 Tax=Nocardioides renjunii TaxID=3095075 RepID=UPI002AFDF4FF|nr:maleylpyruvate isomerase family mycothiol-dependent enzyme [Nocardioides sp. S-34]WQQ24316.1 maleylpyruvate isomerase family mycothiol-dependent enzyme [Nocardioides sp. S-34]